MANKNNIDQALSDRALEMVMRDVLDGVQDISLQSAFTDNPYNVDIISIERPDKQGDDQDKAGMSPNNAEVIYPPAFCKTA
ncbi:MAG: integration host factor subunit beta [gamma proteobacterium endosymbiont of Lamellibrachia anaximandri]|nr:integration host factor subunit beta [gamma proteobacterium endosymbiont of Lamellibrachia anaximandri]MBL3616761.1 integration host factor subunit beta [gamma proteobacterium endosymbiont of Lamellibrachia anaximandri]